MTLEKCFVSLETAIKQEERPPSVPPAKGAGVSSAMGRRRYFFLLFYLNKFNFINLFISKSKFYKKGNKNVARLAPRMGESRSNVFTSDL